METLSEGSTALLRAVTAMTKKMLERRNYNYIEFTEDDKCGKKPRFVASKKMTK